MRLFVIALLGLLFLSPQFGNAQSDFQQKRKVAHLKVISITAPTGKPIPIKRGLKKLDAKTMLILKGIPSNILLNQGVQKNGIWTVPYAKLDKLKLIYPSHCTITFEILVYRRLKGITHKIPDFFLVDLKGTLKTIAHHTKRSNSPLSRCRYPDCIKTSHTCKKESKPTFRTFNIEDISIPSGKAENTIHLNITIGNLQPGKISMFLLRGIPPQIKLNTGFAREDIWSISVKNIDKVALILPPAYKGKFDAEAYLFRNVESGPERTRFSVKIK